MPTIKKLIEVALPLEAINAESAREKSIRHGHPSTLHLWWARRPLATARAVIWSSLVDDPSSHPEQFPTEEAQQQERERLFGILTRLVKWENSNDEGILAEAKAEIMKSTNGNPPALLDPFAGGGAIPLEAQRLGLEGRSRAGGGCALLRRMDEAGSLQAHRAFVPQGEAGRWQRSHRDCVDLGANGEVSKPGVWMRNAAG